MIGTRIAQCLKNMGGHIGRDVKLPPQFADVGDAMRPRDAKPDLDLARGAEGKTLVAQIIGADR